MNCQYIQPLLNRFHDGEWTPAEASLVEAHLGTCVACQAELVKLRELSELTAALSEPEPPGDLWERVTAELPPARPSRVRAVLRSGWAAAASILLVAGATGGWLAHRFHTQATSIAGVDYQVEPVLDDLLAIRSREPMNLEEATQLVHFPLLTSEDLPEGCRFEKCCLCKCGLNCCDMVQCQFRCQGQSMLLVQGSPDHPVHYGDRAVVHTQINGQPASVVECEGCLACSWQKKNTVLTLVGPRNLDQLVQIAAHVDRRFGEKH